MRINERINKRGVILIIIAHFILGIVYSAVIPIYEAHDETGHYPYVRYLATHRAFPPIGGELTAWFDEAHQPPLYYLLGAAATFWIDTADYQPPVINPHGFSGTGRGGYNLIVHTDAERFPWRGAVLAIHVARLVSVIISTATVWVIYLIAREIFPARRDIQLGATAIGAFSPQFLYMGSVVNNDALIILWGAVITYLLVRVVGSASNWRMWVAIGLSLGGALLTKNSALAYVPLIGLVLGIAAGVKEGKLELRKLEIREFLRRYIAAGIVTFGTTAVVAGWWYARNIALYGTPLPDRAAENPITKTLAPLAASAREAASRSWIGELVSHTFRTYWGAFGWGNIVYTDTWIYWLLALLSLLGVLGTLWFMWRRGTQAQNLRLAVLFLTIGATFALPLYRAVYFIDPYLVPGRYLLPALGAISVIIVVGLSNILPSNSPQRGENKTSPLSGGIEGGRSLLCIILALAFFALALITPFRYIAPVYARPPLLHPDDAQLANPLYLNYDNKLVLLGYEVDKTRLLPGEELRVTLLWQAVASMEHNYTIGVHILGQRGQSLGKLDTFPGNGNLPTTQWHAGEIIKETYPLELSPDALTPALGRIAVGVHDYRVDDEGNVSDRALPTYDAQGMRTTATFGRVKLLAESPRTYEVDNPVAYNFGNAIDLIGYKLSASELNAGDTLLVKLYWQARTSIERDYAVFVHLTGRYPHNADDANIAAQTDEPPQQLGEYPTGIWDAGEVVRDEHAVVLPDNIEVGEYRVVVGLYDKETGARLMVTDDNGQELGDSVELEAIEVKK